MPPDPNNSAQLPDLPTEGATPAPATAQSSTIASVPPQLVASKASNKKAIVAVVLSLVGLVMTGTLGLIGIPVLIIATVIAAKDFKVNRSGGAIAALIISAIAVILTVSDFLFYMSKP